MYLFHFFLSGNTFRINRLREIVPTNKYKIRSQQGQVPTACNSGFPTVNTPGHHDIAKIL
jgi:hypothetical protein